MEIDSTFVDRLRGRSDRLFDLLANFHQPRILVVGDLTLDEFLTGQVERLSREAPVLIVRHETTQQVPGGGANAVYNLAQLGAQVKVAGLVGQDQQGEALKRIFTEAGVDVSGMFPDRDRPTVTKTRVSAHARQSVTQQVVRIDRKSDAPPAGECLQAVANYIRDQIDTVDAVVCSDYGEGVLSPATIAAALSHPLTVVDTQKHLERYRGATLFTPNLPEAELAVGYAIDSLESLQQAGKDLIELTQAKYMLLTRGDAGMSLFDAWGNHEYIPAFNRTDVFDVTGAGDTVVAALSVGLALQGSAWEAAVLGNLAASLVVRQFGTSTTNAADMRRMLATLLEPGMLPEVG
jgi:rfaE bifunctional protein kinase chain/domain